MLYKWHMHTLLGGEEQDINIVNMGNSILLHKQSYYRLTFQPEFQYRYSVNTDSE